MPNSKDILQRYFTMSYIGADVGQVNYFVRADARVCVAKSKCCNDTVNLIMPNVRFFNKRTCYKCYFKLGLRSAQKEARSQCVYVLDMATVRELIADEWVYYDKLFTVQSKPCYYYTYY